MIVGRKMFFNDERCRLGCFFIRVKLAAFCPAHHEVPPAWIFFCILDFLVFFSFPLFLPLRNSGLAWMCFVKLSDHPCFQSSFVGFG